MSHILDKWKLAYGKGLTLSRLRRWRKDLQDDRVKLREQEFNLMPIDGGYYGEVKDKLADIEEVLGHLGREYLEEKARISILRKKGRERMKLKLKHGELV